MDLSDEDRKQLDRLMEQHLNGELSDEEYQRRSWEILKEKQSPSASQKVVSPQTGRPGGFAANPQRPPGLISQSVSPQDLERLERRQRRGRKRLIETAIPLAFIFVFGVGFALVFGLVNRGPSVDGAPPPAPQASKKPPVLSASLPAKPPPKVDPSPAAPLPEAKMYFTPTFGEYAVSACKAQCVETREGTARQACLRDCPSLSLAAYGRRITLEPLDATVDAEELFSRCTKMPLRLDSHSSGIQWEEELEAAANLLSKAHLLVRRASVGSMQDLYRRLLTNVRTMRAPPGRAENETAASERVVRASCVRAGIVLAGVAEQSARERSDEFSAAYFVKFTKTLDDLAAPYQHKALSAVGELGLFSYE